MNNIWCRNLDAVGKLNCGPGNYGYMEEWIVCHAGKERELMKFVNINILAILQEITLLEKPYWSVQFRVDKKQTKIQVER